MRKQQVSDTWSRLTAGNNQGWPEGLRAAEIAALIHAFGYLVAQVDEHRVGAAIVFFVAGVVMVGRVFALWGNASQR